MNKNVYECSFIRHRRFYYGQISQLQEITNAILFLASDRVKEKAGALIISKSEEGSHSECWIGGQYLLGDKIVGLG